MTGFQSHVSQDVPPFMMVAGNPLRACAASTSKACAGAASRAERIAAVKQMHRLLYRDGPDAGAGARGDRGAAPASCRGGDADVALMLDFLAAAAARHRALTAADGPRARLRLAMVAGEASGDLLAGLLLGGAARSAGRRCRPPASAGRRWRPGLRGLVAARQAGGARLCRGAAPLPRDRRHPPPAGRAAAARAARRPSSASTRPTSTSTSRRGCSAAGIKTVHFVCPSIWAWRGERVAEDRPRASTMCCACSRSSPSSAAQHGIAATYVGHPLADAIPLRAAARRSRARAGPGRRRHGGRAAARQPALARSSYIAPRLAGSGRADAPRSGRSCASCCRWRPGCAALVEPLLAAARAGVPHRSCSTAARTRRWPPAT